MFLHLCFTVNTLTAEQKSQGQAPELDSVQWLGLPL